MFSSQNSQVSSAANYIEDVFSTYLYTGNGTSQTITNGIDLAGEGGLVWIKGRNNSWSHILQDTNRGVNSSLTTNNTEKAVDSTGIYVTSFNSNGFSIGPNGPVNFNTNTYVSWAFREQAKFYTQGTYTGTGSVQNITHDLGSIPAFIIVKDTTNDGSAWAIYHTSLGNTKYLQFTTDAAGTSSGYWNNTSPTSTQFTVGTNGNVNLSGATYVYYAFAHNAGGFGLTGTDNVISCGSFNVDGSGNATVDLGYEPQWVMIKTYETTANWAVFDNMRGMPVGNTNVARLFPNTSGAESSSTDYNVSPTATGFTAKATGYAGSAYDGFIYIAIRRGPMKVPTSGTSVFAPVTYTGDNTSTKQLTSGFPIDLIIGGDRSSPPSNVFDRLRGVSSASPVSYTASTADEQSSVYGILGMTYLQTGDGTVRYQNSTGVNYVDYFFRRAPSFFDEVCYTGTGTTTKQFNHNLGVYPELVIQKRRDSTSDWYVSYVVSGSVDKTLLLDTTGATGQTQAVSYTTTTTFAAFDSTAGNISGATYVAYLFATCAGVSKVGSYTGTATTKQVDCGFTGGARFVLIKRTDSTGAWYVWDSARGIVSGNDPYLLLNSTAAEVTSTDYVDTYSAGFEISSTAPAAINASGGTFIFLAIA